MGGGDILNIVVAAVTGYISGGIPGMVISVALAFASMALAPKPKKPDAPNFSVTAQDRKQNFRQPITARKVVYGEIQVGGPIVFLETTAGNGDLNDSAINTYLHMVIVVASHEITEFKEFYVNGNLITPNMLDTNGNITATGDSEYFKEQDSNTSYPYLRIQTALGTDTQGANADLISESGGKWTSAHTLSGMAYIYFRFRYDANLWGGVPNVKAVIKGKKILDTRTSQTAFSSNPAMIIRDYLTSDLGLKVPAGKIDNNTVVTAANICDESQSLSGGGTENRYEAHGMISTESKPREILNELLTSMSGVLSYSNGLYKVFAAGTGTSVLSIDESDIVGELTVQSRLSRRDTFNAIKGTFISAESDWEETDYPALEVASFIAEDNGATIYRDFSLPFTTSSSMAQRIAKIQLYAARQPVHIQGVFKCTCFIADINDIIKVSNTRYGWSNKEFRVTSWGFATTPNGLLVNMGLTEYAASSYSWSTTEQQAMADAPNTNLPSAFVVLTPTNLQVSENLFTTRDNARVASRMKITWVAANDSQVDMYQVEYKLSTDSVFISAGNTVATEAEVLDLPAGVYNIRVRAKNILGKVSEYVATVFSLSGLSAAPANVTNFTLITGGGLGVLAWDKSTDLDVTIGGGVEIRWTPATSSATWITSILVDGRVAGSATNKTLPLRAGTYLAKFFDSSGNYSPTAVGVVSENETILAYTNAATITESPNFTGTKTRTMVSSNKLQLTSSVDLDDVANFDLIADFDFLGNVNTTGIYEFATKLDKSSPTRIRLQASVTSAIVNILDLVDSRAANIDTWADFDGTGDAAVCNVETYYASTNDDPASGSATWSPYKLLQSNEAFARGFKFKAELSTNDTAYNIQVSALSVTSTTI